MDKRDKTSEFEEVAVLLPRNAGRLFDSAQSEPVAVQYRFSGCGDVYNRFNMILRSTRTR